jgi:hypothetical protein
MLPQIYQLSKKNFTTVSLQTIPITTQQTDTKCDRKLEIFFYQDDYF